MRALIAAALAAGFCASVAGCGTASRYEYYDYGGGSVDEKNAEKADRIGRTFKRISPAAGRLR